MCCVQIGRVSGADCDIADAGASVLPPRVLIHAELAAVLWTSPGSSNFCAGLWWAHALDCITAQQLSNGHLATAAYSNRCAICRTTVCKSIWTCAQMCLVGMSTCKWRMFVKAALVKSSRQAVMIGIFAGKALRIVGAAGALAAVPAVTLLTTAVLAWHPVPAVLMVVETSRKVSMYSLAKPARELLFTQMSSDVKYKAKLVLDTVVQRSGDAAGAAVFALLGVLSLDLCSSCVCLTGSQRLNAAAIARQKQTLTQRTHADAQTISASRLASICTCVAAVWIAIAFTLGRRYDVSIARGVQMA